jgi:cytochrome P450
VQSATSIEACRVFRQTTIKHEPLSGCAPYPTTAECLEHARYCEWYAARTNDDGDRKFVLRKVRYDSSVQVTGRTTLEYVDKIGGISLEKGQSVICLLGSANRDPLVYSDPDRLDITRRDVRPLSFGGGIHHCVGAQLARIEAEVAIATLLRRLPTLQLDSSERPDWRRTFVLRGLNKLSASW